MTHRTRRSMRLGTTIAALALAVSACGGDDGDGGGGGDAGGGGDQAASSPSAPTALPTDGAPSTLTPVWTGELVGAVAVTGGFVGLEEDEEAEDALDVVMLSADDGSEVWRQPVEAEGERPRALLTASPDGSTVYAGVVSSSGAITAESPAPVLTAYDAATGDERWTAPVEGGLEDPEADAVDASAGLILAWGAVVSPEDGSILREPPGLGDENAVPLGDDRVLVGDTDAHVESADGEEVWSLDDADLPPECEPQSENGEAFYEGTFEGVLVVTCYDPSGTEQHVAFLEGESGALLGGLPIAGAAGSEQVAESTHDAASDVTVLSGPIGTLALDRAAGELTWHEPSLTSTEFRPGPAHDGLVYGSGAVVSEEDGTVAEDGDWRRPLAITSDGVLLFSEDEHTTQVIAMTVG
jgi:outer membrane protein assembly factor BamB